MMDGATLLSLGQPVLEKIFSYNFPINMLRAVACCQQLHTALGEKLKASTHFARADWVILGEIDKPGFNGRVGQIIQLSPGDRTRYAVQVDGLSGRGPPTLEGRIRSSFILPPSWRPQTLEEMCGAEEGISRPFSLSRFKLHKIPATVCAVRLHTQNEMQRNLIPSDSVRLTCREFRQTFAVSAAQIPSQLAIFSNPSGQSPVMEALGRPVVLRQVISANEFQNLSHCHASCVLRMGTRDHPDQILDAFSRRTSSGPTIIAWQNQSDFTLDDMKQVWEFQHAVRYMPGSEKDTLGRLWKEAGLVNNIRTQEVFHQEPPAVISPDEAERLVEAQFASTIQSEPMPSTKGEFEQEEAPITPQSVATEPEPSNREIKPCLFQ